MSNYVHTRNFDPINLDKFQRFVMGGDIHRAYAIYFYEENNTEPCKTWYFESEKEQRDIFFGLRKMVSKFVKKVR